MDSIALLDARAVQTIGDPLLAVEALETALRNGLDPSQDIPRSSHPVTGGSLLVMPSASMNTLGIKVLTVGSGPGTADRPRIQGSYLTFDPETLAPLAVLDGPALTEVRTPAVSFAATRRRIVADDGPARVVLFGAGPQARGHLRTLRALLPADRAVVATVVTRSTPDEFTVDGCQITCVRAASEEAAQATATAGVIVCATSAREPLFDSRLIRDDATVIAVGSHEPDHREVDRDLVARAHVVVEDPVTALREAGEIVDAIGAGAIEAGDLIPMRDVVLGDVTPDRTAPLLFKSTGMSWEDAIVARAVLDHWQSAGS